MYGTAEFYSKCKSAGIKPILGVEAYVAPRGRKMKEARLDQTAYQVGRKLAIDPKNERFVHDKEADAMLTREYRKGFEIS